MFYNGTMKKKMVNFRMTEEDKRNLQREAKRNGLNISEYVRHLSQLKVDLKMTIRELRVK
jgi:hypothetical protein